MSQEQPTPVAEPEKRTLVLADVAWEDLQALRKLCQKARDIHGEHGLVKFTFKDVQFEFGARQLLRAINEHRKGRSS